MADDVGEGFLNDPVGRKRNPGGYRIQITFGPNVDRHPNSDHIGNERVQLGQARCRTSSKLRRVLVAEKGHQSAHLSQCAAA